MSNVILDVIQHCFQTKLVAPLPARLQTKTVVILVPILVLVASWKKPVKKLYQLVTTLCQKSVANGRSDNYWWWWWWLVDGK